jgi:hypothetical protein
MNLDGFRFTTEITLGNMLLLGMFVLFLWRVERFFDAFLIEHEILIRWYCEQHGLVLSSLPTRIKTGLWRKKS